MNDNLLLYSLIIFFAALLGGLLTFFKRWSDELLHMFVSFGAGIFIGTVFLHLMPEALSGEHAHQSALFVLAGFLLVFFVEKFLTISSNGGYDHNHQVISITAMVGLSVHSLIEGMGLAVGAADENLGTIILFSILAHKTTAAFSLASLFLLAKMGFKKRLSLLVFFSAMTPLGSLFFASFLEGNSEALLAPLVGMTAGTFLYVAVGELLPEVFHTREHRWLKLGLLLLGVVIMSLIEGTHH